MALCPSAGPVPKSDNAEFLLYQNAGTAKHPSSVPLCTASAMSKAFTTAPEASRSIVREPPVSSETTRAKCWPMAKNMSPEGLPDWNRRVIAAAVDAAGAATPDAGCSLLPQPASPIKPAPPATAAVRKKRRRVRSLPDAGCNAFFLAMANSPLLKAVIMCEAGAPFRKNSQLPV